MARRSSGMLYKRGDKWWLLYFANGQRIRQSLDTSDKLVAEKERKRIMHPITADTEVDRRRQVVHAMTDAQTAASLAVDMPLAEAMGVFSTTNGRATRTVTSYRQRWEMFCGWIRAHHPHVDTVGKVTRQHALAYADHLGEKNTAPATFNAHRQALSLITRKVLLKIGSGAYNPWQSVELKPLTTVGREAFTNEQVAALGAKLADLTYRLPARAEWDVAYHLGLFAGLRLADAVLIQWQDIDLERGELSVVPQKTRRKNKRVTLPILKPLYDRLASARQWRSNDDVLPTLAARCRTNPSGVQKDAVRVVADIGIETAIHVKGRTKATPQYGFHSCRHFFVSACRRAGVSLAVVEAMVGHGSPAMTRHYTHMDPATVRREMDAMPGSIIVVAAQAAPLALPAITNADDDTLRQELARRAAAAPTDRLQAAIAALGTA